MHLADNTVVIVPPVAEPITIEEVRRFLRIDVPGYAGDTSQDDVIASCITGARKAIEDNIDRSIGVQTLLVAADSFDQLAVCYPGASSATGIELPYGPIRSIESIKYLTSDGQDLTVDPTSYRVTETPPQRIVLKPGRSWPAASYEPESVRITYIAGMGPASRIATTTSTEAYANDYADDYTGSLIVNPAVPADRYTISEALVIALRLLIGHYYVNRGALTNPAGPAPELPLGVQWILWPNRSSIGI